MTEIPKHLRIGLKSKLRTRFTWMFATAAERGGCRLIARMGGSFSYHRFVPFGSSVRQAYLRYVPVTDNDMTLLARWSSCVALDLGETRLTDAGVPHLSEMKALEYLFIWHTKISDASVEWLGRMKQLRMLSVFNTAISDEGIDRLHRTLPDCLICISPQDGRYKQWRGIEAMQMWCNRDDVAKVV